MKDGMENARLESDARRTKGSRLVQIGRAHV